MNTMSAQGVNPASHLPFEQDNTPTTLPPPPPYTDPTPAEEDLDEGDEEYNPQPPPTSIYINASIGIQGSNNLVTTMPLDTVHLVATVMAGLRQRNPQVAASNLHVQIQRVMNIVGDRNVVGPFGVRPRQQPNAATAARVTAARKRKAEEQSDGTPEAKRASARAKSCPPS
jgi:hypothetical protein